MAHKVAMARTGTSIVGKVTDRNRGYTLIELSVVVLLLGLVLTLTFPRIRDTLLNDDLKVTTRQLIGTAQELRSTAIREQTDMFLQIDLTQGSYWSYPGDATPEKRDELRRAARLLPSDVRWASVRRAGEVGKLEGETSLRFSRQGYTTPAVLQLARDERAMTLVFQPFLREVTLYDQLFDHVFNEEDRDAIF